MNPSELEFEAEDEPVRIIPRFQSEHIHLLSCSLGPFTPNVPLTVPFWVAIHLRQQQKCRIVPPDWLSVERLTTCKQSELEESACTTPPHSSYMEITTLLLQHAAEDLCKITEGMESVAQGNFQSVAERLLSTFDRFWGTFVQDFAAPAVQTDFADNNHSVLECSVIGIKKAARRVFRDLYLYTPILFPHLSISWFIGGGISLMQLLYHYVISPESVRTLVRDIWDIRMGKLVASVTAFISSGSFTASISQLTSMEIAMLRKFLANSMDQLYVLRNSVGDSNSDLMRTSQSLLNSSPIHQ